MIWRRAAKNAEEGPGLVAYGLIVALITVVCVAALGAGSSDKLQSVSSPLGS